MICDSCQLVQEVQHERSIKGSSQKGENIRKSLKQNIGIRKSYSGKHDIPCNLETEGKSVVLTKLLEHVRVSTRAKSYDETMQDKDNIKTLQQNDEILSQIFLWKSNNKKPTWSDISHTSPEIKFYWSGLNSFIIKDEILYRKWESNDSKNYDLHLVIPKSLNGFVLNQVHNTLTGGHLGVRKTLYKIKKRYFWYQIRNDVKNWCSKCDTCAMKKAPHRKPEAPMCKYLVGAPWERMAIDILGPLPRTDNGNKYIMVVGDYFTKWMEAIPILDAEAKTVADKFVERIVSIFGVPLQIHSDQGSNFESKVFKEFSPF